RCDDVRTGRVNPSPGPGAARGQNAVAFQRAVVQGEGRLIGIDTASGADLLRCRAGIVSDGTVRERRRTAVLPCKSSTTGRPVTRSVGDRIARDRAEIHGEIASLNVASAPERIIRDTLHLIVEDRTRGQSGAASCNRNSPSGSETGTAGDGITGQ